MRLVHHLSTKLHDWLDPVSRRARDQELRYSEICRKYSFNTAFPISVNGIESSEYAVVAVSHWHRAVQFLEELGQKKSSCCIDIYVLNSDSFATEHDMQTEFPGLCGIASVSQQPWVSHWKSGRCIKTLCGKDACEYLLDVCQDSRDS